MNNKLKVVLGVLGGLGFLGFKLAVGLGSTRTQKEVGDYLDSAEGKVVAADSASKAESVSK